MVYDAGEANEKLSRICSLGIEREGGQEKESNRVYLKPYLNAGTTTMLGLRCVSIPRKRSSRSCDHIEACLATTDGH